VCAIRLVLFDEIGFGIERGSTARYKRQLGYLDECTRVCKVQGDCEVKVSGKTDSLIPG
jgi:hypothetical protein